MKTKILQIITCSTELYARYKDANDFTTRIVCLALIEETDDDVTFQSVVGMDCVDDEFSIAERSSNFTGYTDKPIPELP